MARKWTLPKIRIKNSYEFYAASCNPSGGIHHFAIHSDDKLCHLGFTPCDRPMYMARGPRRLYAILRCPEERVGNMTSFLAEYAVRPKGKLKLISKPKSTRGCVACHLSIIDGEVYVANYASSNIVKMSDPDGVITHHGSGPNLPRQSMAHTHFVGVTPDGKYLTVADLGLDTVYLYNRDMTPHTSAKVTGGHGPRHLLFSACGRYLFVVSELGSSLTVFSYDGNQLAYIDSISTVPTGFSGENTAAAIRLRYGKIYVSNRGHNSIAKISFNGTKLTLETTYPCGGKSPRDFDFIGEYIAVANQHSNSIDLLAPEYNEGGEICGYKHTDSFSAPAPLCIVKR